VKLPRRAYALLGALVAFAVVIFGILIWAAASGSAGGQRGLVVRSQIPGETLFQVESSSDATAPAETRSERLNDGRRQVTIVVKREQFPATFRVRDLNGVTVVEQIVSYDFLADAEFRISYDTNGFYGTTELRTPPASTQEVP
jgi:hypothetical protein